ncbi:MAG: SH3 domain-containing protein [Chloroflexi bacterium]|nr:SH3 domain-containing protein [Chloroflexota bacterium]
MIRYYWRLSVLLSAVILLSTGLLFDAQPGKAQDIFGSNWSAVYYPTPNFSGTPTVTRVENAINFNYGAGSPDPQIPADNFSARFTGTQTFSQGTFTFTLVRDGGARVFLDGQLILNHTEGGLATFQTTIAVTGGARNIVVEYIAATGNAQIVFSWRQASGSIGGGGTGGTLTYGQTVTGTVPVGGNNAWTFSGTQGDVITIACNAGTPPTLDPTITVLGPTGQQVAFNDDIVFGVNLNALISNLTLPATGTYTIVIAGFAGTGGTYTLTLTSTASATAITAEVVNVRGLSLRTGPYLGATFIQALRPGTQFAVVARNRDEGIYTWYQLRVPIGQPLATPDPLATAIPGVAPVAQQFTTGWASGRYLQLSGDANAIPLQATIFDQIDGAADVGVLAIPRAPMNLRRRPSTRTQVLAEVPWGGVVPLIGRTVQGGENFWLQVRYNNFVGWIYAPFVSIEGDVDAVPIR